MLEVHVTTYYCFALYTLKTEFMVAMKAVKEALWLRGLLGELGVDQKVTFVHCDG